MIIHFKDLLQISAVDVPSSSTLDSEPTGAARGFKTDGEISKNKGGTDRELVAWGGGDGGEGGLEDTQAGSGNGTSWDQFGRNEQLFGISTTFNEELYTTKLDPNSIPRAKREEAERLAKEIESGNMHSEMDASHGVDADDDEEGRFSAVKGTGAYAGGSSSNQERPNGRETMALSQMPPMPEDRLASLENAKRSAAGSGTLMMKTSMISEMKRINALNLEPAVRSEAVNIASQGRTDTTKGGTDLKTEFQQSLDLIKGREQKQQQKMQQQQQQTQDHSNQRGSQDNQHGQGNMQMQSQNQGGGNGGRSSFQFNPNAKDFSFNPGATSFTPTNAGSAAGGSAPALTPSNQQQQAQQKSAAPSPAFNIGTGGRNLHMKLDDILDGFLGNSKSEVLRQLDPAWPEAQGASYKDVLGQPNPSSPLPPASMAAPHQQPQQMQQQQQQQQPMGRGPMGQTGPVQGQAPQMMPQQGFMMAAPGQNPQVF